ncbi:MAG: hypothetical protein LQ350_001637 [Teloschistes chrysophthalmus]|nr:MAG: hypothetical protein LQ350_001637 [Niorma chrysophthalma]
MLGIKEVQIIQWFVEPEARVEQFDKLCEVQSDKAAIEITSRYDGVIKKLHYAANDTVQVGKPLCDIDVLSQVEAEDEAAVETSAEQAGSPSSPQQPQKAAEQYQSEVQENGKPQQDTPTPRSNGKHKTLATPAVRGLLKDLKINITQITGTGKDGRVLKEDVQKHASSPRTPSNPPSTPTPTNNGQTETPITLTPIQAQMFKKMTRSLSIPHFLYADELDITALSRLRTTLNNHSNKQKDHHKLSYLPFIIKALALALDRYPILNARVETPTTTSTSTSTSPPRLILRSQINIGIAMDTPLGLIVPNIKSTSTLSILSIAAEIRRLSALARAGKLTPHDLTGGTFTVSNIGSIGGTYVAPIIASGTEVGILGLGRARTVAGFDDGDGDGDGGGRWVRREVMHMGWSADHRVVDGATVARCAEEVRGWVERPEGMVVCLR